MSTNRFDEEAAAWDVALRSSYTDCVRGPDRRLLRQSNPTTVGSSNLFFKAICDHLPGLAVSQYSSKRGLEIGCGTGLLSTQLAPHLHEYYGYDTSQGMIDVLTSKINKAAEPLRIKAIKELLVDPASPSLEGKQFDLAVSHLTLHHIPDDSLQSTYQLLYDILSPGGQIILSDFEETAESELFHPKAKHHDVERHGMRKQDLINGLTKAGFQDVNVKESFKLPKACEDGSSRDFPFLIATGVKE